MMTHALLTWHAKSFTDVRRRERGCAVGSGVHIKCLLTVQRYAVLRLAVRVLSNNARIALTRPQRVTRSHVSLFEERRPQTKHWVVALGLFTVRTALRVGAARVARLTASQLRVESVFVWCIHCSACFILLLLLFIMVAVNRVLFSKRLLHYLNFCETNVSVLQYAC